MRRILFVHRSALLILIVLTAGACSPSRKMSVREARAVHLKFKEAARCLPPRSLGEHIDYLVQMNSDTPEMKAGCTAAETPLDKEDLTKLSQNFQHATSWVLRNEANRIFQYGNARHAAIIADYAHPMFWAPFIVVGDGS